VNIRYNQKVLPYALIMLVVGTWIDKGMALIVGGFTPNPFEKITTYMPTIPELAITLMIYAVGGFVLTVLWKIAISIRMEKEGL